MLQYLDSEKEIIVETDAFEFAIGPDSKKHTLLSVGPARSIVRPEITKLTRRS